MFHIGLKLRTLGGAAIVGVSLAIAGCADSQSDASERVSIPFVNLGGISSWEADGEEAIYIEDSHGNWYRAEFWADCLPLNYTTRVQFLPDVSGRLDRNSAIRVNGEECRFRSLERAQDPGAVETPAADEQEIQASP